MSFDVSVIIPTYQRADFLNEALRCVLAQTHAPSEVIVIDDGSPDDAAAQVCARFGNRVRYHKTENGGQPVARNTGVALSSAPWLAFCDDDDLWQPHHLAELARAVAASPSLAFAFSNFSVVRDGVWSTSTKLDDAPREFWTFAKHEVADGVWVIDEPMVTPILCYQAIFPSTIAVSRGLFEKVGGFDRRMSGIPAEDLEFLLRCVAQGPIGLVTQPTVGIRKHENNDSGSDLKQFIGEICVLGHVLRHHDLDSSWRSAVIVEINRRIMTALNAAFASGNMEFFRILMRLVAADDVSLKIRAKMVVASLPDTMSSALNHLLARGGILASRPIPERLKDCLCETAVYLTSQQEKMRAI